MRGEGSEYGRILSIISVDEWPSGRVARSRRTRLSLRLITENCSRYCLCSIQVGQGFKSVGRHGQAVRDMARPHMVYLGRTLLLHIGAGCLDVLDIN